MARRRKTRTVYRNRPKKRSRSRSRTKQAAPYMAAGLYGAGRQKLAEFVQPFAARIPGGNMADEIAMMGANWAIKKFVGNKIPIVGQAAKVGMLIEAASIGESLAAGSLNLGGQSNNTGFGATLG